MNKATGELIKSSELIKQDARAKWIKRQGSRQRGFRYVDANGEKIISEIELERIKALVIPPAWVEVRICPNPRGKLQAIGTDSAGRVQYRYSEKFSAARQKTKFARVLSFGNALPALRRQLNADITLENYPKQ